jgi:hypothetical protein
MGYTWPPLMEQQRDSPRSKASPVIEISDEVVDLILPKRFPRLPHVIVIIMYNWEVPVGIPRIMQRMYEPIFAKVRNPFLRLHTPVACTSIPMHIL